MLIIVITALRNDSSFRLSKVEFSSDPLVAGCFVAGVVPWPELDPFQPCGVVQVTEASLSALLSLSLSVLLTAPVENSSFSCRLSE